MESDKIRNVTIHYDKEITVQDNEISGENKFKATLIIDNITQHHYKIYKITVEHRSEKEGDVLITLYSEVTRLASNILVPSNKEMLIIINDTFW